MRDIVSPIDGIRSPFGPSRLVPALYLPFAMTGSLDSRITFSRASQATMYDSTGKLTFAPNNLVTYSDTPSNAAWNKSNTTVSGNVVTLTGAPGAFQLIQNGPPSTPSAGNTFIWAVQLSGSGTITLDGNGFAGTQTCTLSATPTWFFVKLTYTSGTAACRVISYGGNTATSFTFHNSSFSRVTYETAIRTADQVITTAAAYYGPRFDYNPATLAARGLLIEEARTNLFLQSEAFGSSPWANYGTNTVTPDATTAPDGTSRADLLTGNVGNGRTQLITGISPNTAYTLSIYTKLASVGNQFSFSVPCFYGGSYLGNLVADASPLITSGEDVGGGWYRNTFTGTTPATTDRMEPRFVAANTGDNYYLWGAQIEAGSDATSYIPTAAASVARAADAPSMTGTNFSSWYNQSEGAFVVNFTPRVSSGSRRVLGYDVTAASTPMFIASSTSVQVFDGSNVRASASGLVIGSANKAAMAYTDGVSHSIVVNAGTVGTSATDYNTGTPTAFLIGYIGSSNYLNGWIMSINYYNTRLPNATIQSLTA